MAALDQVESEEAEGTEDQHGQGVGQPALLIGGIDAGQLAAFRPPGKDLAAKSTGPKGLRVMPDDWDRFVKSNTVTGQVAVETTPEPTTKPTPSTTGTDGKRRSKRRF